MYGTYGRVGSEEFWNHTVISPGGVSSALFCVQSRRGGSFPDVQEQRCFWPGGGGGGSDSALLCFVELQQRLDKYARHSKLDSHQQRTCTNQGILISKVEHIFVNRACFRPAVRIFCVLLQKRYIKRNLQFGVVIQYNCHVFGTQISKVFTVISANGNTERAWIDSRRHGFDSVFRVRSLNLGTSFGPRHKFK